MRAQKRAVSISEFARAFGAKTFCMLTYFADESYDNITFCVGGFIHYVESWKEVERKWSERIEYERRRSIKKHETPISRFHAGNCSTRTGEYEDWSVPRQKLFFKKLVGIICKYKPCGIAWSCSFEDQRLHFPEYSKKVAQRVLYFLCMQKCLQDVARIAHKEYGGERVTVFHDWGFNGVAQMAFSRCKKRYDPYNSLVTVAPLKWQERVALQPADLMAYEGCKIGFRYRRNNPEVRRSFQRILGADVPLSVGCITVEAFETAKKEFAAAKEKVLESDDDANAKGKAAQ